jgi:hypothetical protein
MSRPVSLRLGLALLILAIGAAPATAADLRFVAPLSGREEVPPVDTRAAGLASFNLSADETELSYRLIASNIVGVTQAHIHCGPFGENGPVVAFLYGFGPTVDSNGVLATGVITQANVIPQADSAACPGGVTTLADVVAKLRNGGAYANVHTVAWPGGEIRGQIH